MSARQGGLILCQETLANSEYAYFLKKGEAIDPAILVSPVGIQSADGVSTPSIISRGLVGGVPTPYTGGITIEPASSSLGPAPAGLNIHAGASGVVVEVGTNGAGIVNTLSIAGASGLSQVNDGIYNPTVKTTPVIEQTLVVAGSPLVGFTFTPTRTGAYAVQVDLNLYNADVVQAGALEWTITAGGSEVQYMSNTISSASLIKASALVATSEPMDFSTTNIGFLTASTAYNFNLYALVGTLPNLWALQQVKVRIIQMC